MDWPEAFTYPPPPGVDCDCDTGQHWHQRLVGVSCDTCGMCSEMYLFACTRAAALEMLPGVAEGVGWRVSGDTYECPSCSSVTGRFSDIIDL